MAVVGREADGGKYRRHDGSSEKREVKMIDLLVEFSPVVCLLVVGVIVIIVEYITLRR